MILLKSDSLRQPKVSKKILKSENVANLNMFNAAGYMSIVIISIFLRSGSLKDSIISLCRLCIKSSLNSVKSID